MVQQKEKKYNILCNNAREHLPFSIELFIFWNDPVDFLIVKITLTYARLNVSIDIRGKMIFT